MIAVAAYLGCLVALLVVTYKVRAASSAPGGRHLAGFAVCIAGAIGLDAGTTLDFAGTLPAVVELLSDELKVAALCFLVLFANAVRPEAVRGRKYVLVTVLTMIVTPLLFLAAGAAQDTDVVTLAPDKVGVFVAYDVVLMCYEVWGLLTFTVLIGRYARLVEPGLLRTGLRLIIAGALIAVLWSAWQLDDIRLALTTYRNATSEDDVSAVLGAACVVVSAAGSTLTAWGPYLSRPVRWLAAQRRYAQLRPLWAAVHAAMPAIALSSDAGQQGGVEFALYRHVIEIRDAQLALRGHIHPSVPEWAADAVRRAGTPASQRAATIEAATIAAAMLAHDAGVSYRAADLVPHRVAPSLAAETAWLAHVSRAFAHSSAVAQVRTRMAAELSGIPSTRSR